MREMTGIELLESNIELLESKANRLDLELTIIKHEIKDIKDTDSINKLKPDNLPTLKQLNEIFDSLMGGEVKLSLKDEEDEAVEICQHCRTTLEDSKCRISKLKELFNSEAYGRTLNVNFDLSCGISIGKQFNDMTVYIDKIKDIVHGF